MEKNMKKALVTNYKRNNKAALLDDRVVALLVTALLFLISSSITSSISIGAAFAILFGAATKQYLKQKKENKYNLLTQIWPDVIDHLVAGLYSGLSITEALADLEVRGPEIVKLDFAKFRSEIKAGTNFNVALNNLRIKFSHHGSDQIFEALQLSKTLGGGELLNTLRTLGSFQREDLILNKEIAIKQGWIKNSAHISAAAPWLLLLIIGTQAGTAASFASATGIFILVAGVLMTFLAYFWMSHLSKLPSTPRVFRG
jgi:tight adherence protein B